jgi:hypothetical protein
MGAWIIGVIASYIDFQYVMAGATAIYTLFFLAILPRYGYLARHMEAPPPDEVKGPLTKAAE